MKSNAEEGCFERVKKKVLKMKEKTLMKRWTAFLTALLMLLALQGSSLDISYGGTDVPQEPPSQEETPDPEPLPDPEPEPAPDITIAGLQTNLTAASQGMTSIKLSWDTMENATSYELFCKAGNETEYTLLTDTKKTAFTHKNCKTGAVYRYRIRGCRTIDGETQYSKFSETVKAIPHPAAPSLTLGKSDAKITVKWNKKSGVSGYEVYRSTSKTENFKRIAEIKKASVVKYEDKGLADGKVYYYKVRAFKTSGSAKVRGEFSNVKSKKSVNELDRMVTKIYKTATKKAKTKEQKLRACYQYMINGHFGYSHRKHVARGAKGWQESYAKSFLKARTGNCFGWAGAFYYLAKKCGYSPRIYSGSCHYRNGNTGRHGWNEITINGRNYIFDPEMEWSYIHRVGSYYNGWKRVPGTTAMRYIK